ncbi:MAG TPA: sulfatase-like hydrolase/transferase, partial [Pontiella sp.]
GAQYHRKAKTVRMPKGLKMFPYYLRQAGYYTSNCAKEDYNFDRADKAGVWDDSSDEATYRDRKAGQPFFHVQNYFTTHEGQMFRKKWIQQRTNPDSAEVSPYHPDTQNFREHYAQYLSRHMKLDEELGSFIQGLEKDGLLDNTFIFYYGDHGGVLPRSKGYVSESGLQVPMVVYVPKNFRHLVPAEAGSRIDGFVQFTDLSATVLNLAGIDIPEGIDGRPFLGRGILLDELNARDTAFGYADRFDEKYDMVRTLRKGHYKYMRSYQPFNFDGLYNKYRYNSAAYQEWRRLFDENKLNEIQRQFFERRPPESLYDLEKDPHEVNNLAGDPAYADKLIELRGLLQQQVRSMPDLSFIPESVFLAKGCQDPIGFGKKHRREIEKLIDIADLSLRPFPEAKQQIGKALASADPWERYWGLITCSAFGEQAAPFYEEAGKLAEKDDERLVRVRAAEFLGLTGKADPRPVISEVLREVKNPIEANLILNTAALLQDSAPGYRFDLKEFDSAPWKKGEAAHRLDYLMQ